MAVAKRLADNTALLIFGIMLSFFTGAIAAKAGFQFHHGNTLGIENDRLTGEVIPPILDKQAKLNFLTQYKNRMGLDIKDTMAVGDGANDLPMLLASGTGVALHAKPTVQAQCEVRVNHGDLTALLYLQGYSRDEFAPV